MTRESRSTKGTLLRLGFSDPERAFDHVGELGEQGEELLWILARTADPDLALQQLVRLRDSALEKDAGADALLEDLLDDEGFAMRLLSVLGASEALGDHLCRHPDQWRELTDPALGCTRPAAYAVRAGLLECVGADPVADGTAGVLAVLSQWGYELVENFIIVQMYVNNTIATRPYDLTRKAKQTLLFCRRKDRIELRHQRSSDVHFDFVPDGDFNYRPEYVAHVIETLLPTCAYDAETGRGKFLSLWGKPARKRSGWTYVADAAAATE